MLTGESSMFRQRRTLGEALRETHGVAPGLNAIRLGAAVAVLVSHSFDLVGSGASEPLRWVSGAQTNIGGTAVYTFLMISGFLVTPSFLRSTSVADYALKRAMRIFPALVVVVALTALILGPLATTMPVAQYFGDSLFSNYLTNIFLVGGMSLPGVFETTPAGSIVNGSLWTLRYEAICYILLALVGLAGLLGRHRLILGAAAVLIVLGWWAKGKHYYMFDPLGIEFPYILRFMAYFAAGTALYVFRDRIILDTRLAVAALVLLIVFLQLGLYHMFFPILGSYLVAFLGMRPGLDIGALQGRDYSYGFYLYAFPVQQFVAAYAPNQTVWWANVLFSVPLTFLFAALSWHLVEKRALSLVRGRKDRDGLAQPMSTQLQPN